MQGQTNILVLHMGNRLCFNVNKIKDQINFIITRFGLLFGSLFFRLKKKTFWIVNWVVYHELLERLSTHNVNLKVYNSANGDANEMSRIGMDIDVSGETMLNFDVDESAQGKHPEFARSQTHLCLRLF